MNTTELQRKLIAAARTENPSDQVPYAFEKRIMARLQHAAVIDTCAAWAAALWRAAVPCVGITLALTAWAFFATGPSSSTNDLSQDLDNTLLAAAVQDQAAQANW